MSTSTYEGCVTRAGVDVVVRITVDHSAAYPDQDELGEVVGVEAARLARKVSSAVAADSPF